jgi:purine nucleosidase
VSTARCFEEKGTTVVKEILLDTDIGTDVDDCLALATLLGSPELALAGVTTVYGDVLLRARMTQRLLQLAGREHGDIPVYTGARLPLTGTRDIYWEGHEGQGLVDDGTEPPPPRDDAPGFIVETLRARPGEIHLLAIGPLTNIALALHREPRLLDLAASFTIMGGSVRACVDDLHLPIAEHNLKCDPEAARLVFAHASQVTVVPLDVTTKARVGAEVRDALLASPHPFTQAVGDQLRRYPKIARQGWTNPHDPLAVLALAQPDLLPLTSLRVEILAHGSPHDGAMLVTTPTDAKPANVHVALTIDVPAVEAVLRERLLRSP